LLRAFVFRKLHPQKHNSCVQKFPPLKIHRKQAFRNWQTPENKPTATAGTIAKRTKDFLRDKSPRERRRSENAQPLCKQSSVVENRYNKILSEHSHGPDPYTRAHIHTSLWSSCFFCTCFIARLESGVLYLLASIRRRALLVGGRRGGIGMVMSWKQHLVRSSRLLLNAAARRTTIHEVLFFSFLFVCSVFVSSCVLCQSEFANSCSSSCFVSIASCLCGSMNLHWFKQRPRYEPPFLCCWSMFFFCTPLTCKVPSVSIVPDPSLLSSIGKDVCMSVISLCVCVCLYVLPTFHLLQIMILPHEHNPHFSECQINWGRLSCPKNSIQNRSPVLHLLKKKVILEQSWGLGFSAWVLRIEQHCHQMLTIVTEAVYLQSCSCRLSISLECASPIAQLFESCHLLPGMQQGLGFCRTEFLLYQQTGTFFMIYVHTFELCVCVLGFMAIAWLKRSCKWCGKPSERVTHK
jgi:hypothetical protein